ncbi:MAG: LapA family protein [Bacteroidales bacterium]|nr:LapA family protein [Clostridiales bacterium]MCF8309256.1 LapA family protein [Bacteroidales bacterium]
MQRYFFTTIVIIIIMVAFAVLNHGYITIDLLFTKVNASLALTILVVFAIGAIISFLISTPTILKHKKDAKRKGKEIKELKKEVEKLKEQQQTASSQTNEGESASGQNANGKEQE